MYHSNGQPVYQQNTPQQSQSPRSFQQQQFGPRFQTPLQFPPSGSFYQSPQPHHERLRPYQSPVQPQPFYHSNSNLDQRPKPSYPSPVQNFKSPPNPQYPPPSIVTNFNQPSVPPYKILRPPIQNYNQPPNKNCNPSSIQNCNQPLPIQNCNQLPIPSSNLPPPTQNCNQSPLIQNYNNHPPIQNFNQPPPIQNFNPPFQTSNQNYHQPPNPLYQTASSVYDPLQNSYQPQVQNSESMDQPYRLPVGQRYMQQQSSCNLVGHEFNQRPPFRSPVQQRFSLKNQNPRYQQPQHGNSRFQFHPCQQYQNYHPRGSANSNQHKTNSMSKKDKLLIACEMGDCDFVGHASAVKEHQNMHHRLGLHKKVLYSNNSDAVKNWIEERKKKWPTKETIQIKLEVEDEKNKRGERIIDEDFKRFNNKNNKFNNYGSKRFNNRKRTRINGELIEPIEELMNGNLKRFAGIVDFLKKEEIENTNKPIALKLLEEYDESSDEPPEETAILKESIPLDNKSLVTHNKESCAKSKLDVSIENNKKVEFTTVTIKDLNVVVNTEVEIENHFKITKECEKNNSEYGQKRKKASKKEFKPMKKTPPLRTPRTEVMEKKGALLEALMGDLMRTERNAITQCICYIRNNMHRFSKIQAV